jgi:glutamate N-acetyltransferase/amino-acid N-acetyltransferase
VLQLALRRAAGRTFNRVTVDGDSSTNDTIILLASGASGARVKARGPGRHEFEEALQAVLADLALQIVGDGEGATKTIEVRVTGAKSNRDADKVARAVAESQLFKCAVCGGDPNWGRIVCAIGYSGAQVQPARTSVCIGSVCVFAEGAPSGLDAASEMRSDRVRVLIDLGIGASSATAWTCDLTEEYVRINARYHT